jgi:hypothetical protein
MLANFYSIVAAELGDRDLAYRFLLSMVRSYAKPPFYAMSETPSNNRLSFSRRKEPSCNSSSSGLRA